MVFIHIVMLACLVQAEDDDGKGLVEMVMDLLGIDPSSIGEDDNLAGMGIDSMQVVEVRARIQRALGRPIPLEEVRDAPKNPVSAHHSCQAPETCTAGVDIQPHPHGQMQLLLLSRVRSSQQHPTVAMHALADRDADAAEAAGPGEGVRHDGQ